MDRPRAQAPAGALCSSPPTTPEPPQRSPPARAGSHSRASHCGCTVAATTTIWTMVATQDSTAPLAWARAVPCPARTSIPRLAMVAVLDTNPDASADSASAWRACMRRWPTCASDWITSSTMTRRTTTCGFSTPCHKGLSGASGYTSKASAAKMSPLRTSPGCSHWLANWCKASRTSSSPVTTTARAAASNWSRAQVTPIR